MVDFRKNTAQHAANACKLASPHTTLNMFYFIWTAALIAFSLFPAFAIDQITPVQNNSISTSVMKILLLRFFIFVWGAFHVELRFSWGDKLHPGKFDFLILSQVIIRWYLDNIWRPLHDRNVVIPLGVPDSPFLPGHQHLVARVACNSILNAFLSQKCKRLEALGIVLMGYMLLSNHLPCSALASTGYFSGWFPRRHDLPDDPSYATLHTSENIYTCRACQIGRCMDSNIGRGCCDAFPSIQHFWSDASETAGTSHTRDFDSEGLHDNHDTVAISFFNNHANSSQIFYPIISISSYRSQIKREPAYPRLLFFEAKRYATKSTSFWYQTAGLSYSTFCSLKNHDHANLNSEKFVYFLSDAYASDKNLADGIGDCFPAFLLPNQSRPLLTKEVAWSPTFRLTVDRDFCRLPNSHSFPSIIVVSM